MGLVREKGKRYVSIWETCEIIGVIYWYHIKSKIVNRISTFVYRIQFRIEKILDIQIIYLKNSYA